MTTQICPRRSVLFVPGSNERALEKGKSLAADGLILDLEDSVAPEQKTDARGRVMAAVETGGYGRREIIIRVNGLETPWGRDDIAAAAASGADGILLPKVDDGADVREADSILDAAGAPEEMSIWCMMETPKAILNAVDIASASPRVGCLVMGTSDLAKDLYCAHTRDRLPMITSLELCLLAARAYGLAILDGVFLDLDDDEGFTHSCRQGRDLGFDGKTLIHPKTLDPANEIFAPSGEELDWSRKIIAAHAKAEKEGKGVVVVEGKLVETLHVANAKRLMALHDAIRGLTEDLSK
ncbi:MAG: CoA ester lyase [Rhodospirillales bacterium]|nr:CoA ester lyase [Rhodospirillales bacterium]